MYGTDITNINYTLMFDGGSRGNPGICGCGFVIYMNNNIIAEDYCSFRK